MLLFDMKVYVEGLAATGTSQDWQFKQAYDSVLMAFHFVFINSFSKKCFSKNS